MNDARVREVFELAAAMPAGERAGMLADVRRMEPEVAAEVEGLLRFHDEPGAILDRDPAAGVGARTPAEAGTAVWSDEARGLFAPQTVVGAWRLGHVLGAGGVFVVYDSTRVADGHRAAVKIVRPELATGAMIARFEAAGEGLAWVRHDGVAGVLEASVVRDSGGEPRLLLATELVEGPTIVRHANGAGLDGPARLLLAATLCDAVGAGHAQGVLHTNLKPANVRVSAGAGTPALKVLDFGVARLIDDPPGGPAGTIAGKPATLAAGLSRIRSVSVYAAPEQSGERAAPVDERADVHAIGAIVRELVGEPAREMAAWATAPKLTERCPSAAQLGNRLREDAGSPPRPRKGGFRKWWGA